MFCHVSERKYSDFVDKIEKASIKRHIPYFGIFELTYRCNLSCCHCYCNISSCDQKKRDELSTAEVKRLLDEACDMGCLWLLLSGGEVLLREDFTDIYIYAMKKGMIVEIFSNATLIDERIAGVFADFPPFDVDVSIYGSNSAINDKITGVRGSFDRMMNGLKLLRKNSINFSLKTILMKPNLGDLDNMKALAGSLGVGYRFDTVICPRLDGDKDPCDYRLSPEEMVEIDFKYNFKECEEIFKYLWNKKPDEPLECGAGSTTFNVDPYGWLSPCTMFTSFRYNLRERTLKDAWSTLVGDYISKKRSIVPLRCESCRMVLICSSCIASIELEGKSGPDSLKYFCDYASKLEEMFFKNKEEVGHGEEAIQQAGT